MYATRRTDRRDDRPVGDYRDRDWSDRRRSRRDENAPLDERTYGNVWTRVWENRDPRGRRYLTFSQHRVYEQDGRSGITKSFRGPDAEDVIRGTQWAISAMAEESRENEQRNDWPPTHAARLLSVDETAGGTARLVPRTAGGLASQPVRRRPPLTPGACASPTTRRAANLHRRLPPDPDAARPRT